jgi:hypothetical protein
MSFELLADDKDSFLSRDTNRGKWLLAAYVAKRQACKIENSDAYAKEFVPNINMERDTKKKDKLKKKFDQHKKDADTDSLTAMRTWFLQKYFIENPDRDERGAAKSQPCNGWEAFIGAGLNSPSCNVEILPSYSATLSLKFRLLTPLLTRDDNPFYLFDNPVRKDPIFGLPHLSAAGVKGLAADAYQRAFPGSVPWKQRVGENAKDAERTLHFRREDPYALRLFGLADDGADDGGNGAAAGRVHFSPIWFNHVQYLVMNPQDPATGKGTQPIQFEAIAPTQANGRPVEAELQLFYFNPGEAEATVRADLARFLASLASWWPVFGLGAKRLAGYGAIKPTEATCHANAWKDWPTAGRNERGDNSWMALAEHIATGA